MSTAKHDFVLTPEIAETWLQLAIGNIQLEFPHFACFVADSSEDYALHRELHPTFFGSFDWHSCAEMYWVATRLMRLYPGLPSESEARGMIDTLLTAENIVRETAFCRKHPGFERPYGWGWLLKLQAELDLQDDEQVHRWASSLLPLSKQLASQLLEWLPKLTYPQRLGMHPNSAFAMNLSLPYTQQHSDELYGLIAARAADWFKDDVAYPFAYEPSGADFLSGGLTEAVLMSKVMDEETYPLWIERILPTAGAVWLPPAEVSDESDGQIAHLHGLNLSRAWALGELADVLPDRREELLEMRAAHIAVSIDAVAGGGYMLEHWLVAYALLLATEP